MNSRNLADACATILGAFLPYVWHNNPPTTGDQEKWQAVTRLWQSLRPPLEVSGGIEAAKAASGDPTGLRIAEFAAVLAEMFDADAPLKSEVEAVLIGSPLAGVIYELGGVSEPRALVESAEKLRQQIMVDARTRPAAARPIYPTTIPACEVCGRQDASLRVAIYPYVMSILFLTSRRAFAGVWCARHAFIRQLWASLITVTVGWWGIPFGFFFTPVALWRLARGGDQPASFNQQMLMTLAQHHHRKTNNIPEAIRCYQAALEFGESDIIQSRLRELYAQNPSAKPRAASPVLVFSGVLIASILLGLLIGFTDYHIDSLMYLLLGNYTTWIGIVVSWLPFMVIVFLGAVIVVRMIEAAVRWVRLRDQDIATVFALAASAAAVYMIPTGSVLADFVSEASLADFFETTESGLWLITWLFSRGGGVLLTENIVTGEVVSYVYVGLLMLMAVITISAAIVAAQTAVRSQQALVSADNDAHNAEPMPLASGCLPVVALAMVFMAMQAISLLLD